MGRIVFCYVFSGKIITPWIMSCNRLGCYRFFRSRNVGRSAGRISRSSGAAHIERKHSALYSAFLLIYVLA